MLREVSAHCGSFQGPGHPLSSTWLQGPPHELVGELVSVYVQATTPTGWVGRAKPTWVLPRSTVSMCMPEGSTQGAGPRAPGGLWTHGWAPTSPWPYPH